VSLPRITDDGSGIGTVIEVAYLYAFRGGSLVQAVYKGIRNDVEADSAEKLQYKGEKGNIHERPDD
jgi:hypothetical protein